jgi:hypothetical protein
MPTADSETWRKAYVEADKELAAERARLGSLLYAIGACRRPIVGTQTWHKAWAALLELARSTERA